MSAARDLIARVEAGGAWRWDPLARRWSMQAADRVRPGTTLLLHLSIGGYDPDVGFTPEARSSAPATPPQATEEPQEAYDSAPRSLLTKAIPLRQHLADVEEEGRYLCDVLALTEEDRNAVIATCRWHDIGKLHAAFDSMIREAHRRGTDEELPANEYWAKAGRKPERKPPLTKYVVQENGGEQERRHFRHELASALAWLQVRAYGSDPFTDLVAYLIGAHHGKVRLSLRSLPGETMPSEEDRLFARGVWQRDRLPAFTFADGETLPQMELALDVMQLGEGQCEPLWTARTQ